MRLSAALAGVLLALAMAPAARAEEGRVTLQGMGGVSMLGPDLPTPGGAASASLDYGLLPAVSLIAGSDFLAQRSYDTLGLGGGLKLIPLQGEWARLYLLLEPQLLLAWQHLSAGGWSGAHVDFAGYGGLGFEYLLLWGLGVAVELTGTLPAGLGGYTGGAPGSFALTAGLYMEL